MSLFFDAESLRNWAITHQSPAVLPHVVRRLVSATVSTLTALDFPAYESIQRPGFDGVVECTKGNAWVPSGRSVWELSTEDGVRAKAQRDFDKRTVQADTKTPEHEQERASYIFLTPRRFNQKIEWAAEQSRIGHWREVRAYDADDIEQWAEHAPAGIQAWLGRKLGTRPDGICDLAAYWSGLASSAEHTLTPEVFVGGRSKLVDEIIAWISGNPGNLALTTRSPTEVPDLFAAVVAGLPEAYRESIESRSIIVKSAIALERIVESVAPSIVVVDPSVNLAKEVSTQVVRAGHHLLTAADPSLLAQNRESEIPRAGTFAIRQALEQSGYLPARAEQLARSCGGSIAILKNRLQPRDTQELPDWASEVSDDAITASLLLGGWEDDKPDVELFAEIAGQSYEACQVGIQRMATSRNPLLLHAAGKWRLISKDFAWSLFENRIAAAAIKRFEELAAKVLADDDPRYDLPESERLFANLHGHVPIYSSTLKQHVAETLAFLGAFGDQLSAAASLDIRSSVNKIVASVLPPTVSWHRWASLGSRLALLAEASPASFLHAMREDLQKEEPELVKLLYEEEDAMFGRCNHAGLLWALETLAWHKEHLPEVVEFLLKLIEHDAGEKKWGNRPKNSLCEILSYWMPYTTVDVEGRIKCLDLMIRLDQKTTWTVLLNLLPQVSGGVSMPTHKPHWRSWANEWVAGETRGNSVKFVAAVAERIIKLLGNDQTRWIDVLGQIERIPYTTRAELVRALGDFADAEIPDDDRRKVAEILGKKINEHRHFQDAQWSLPEQMLDDLDKLHTKLKPRRAALRNAWLFEQWPDRFFERCKDVAERDKALEIARLNAIGEILESESFEGILQLAQIAESPYTVGWALANRTEDQFFDQIFPSKMEASDKARDFANGFVWKRYYPDRWAWVDSALGACSSNESATNVLLALRFGPEVWQRARQLGSEVNESYWAKCRALNPELSSEDVTIAVHMLLLRHRPIDALNLLSMALHQKRDIPTESLLRSLEAVVELPKGIADRQFHRMDAYRVQEIIAELQRRTDAQRSRMIQIEWHFIRFLDEHSTQSPKTLHNHLASSPEFFHEVLSACFRSRNAAEEKVDQKPTAHQRYMAEHAFHLLHNWNVIPGTIDAGPVDEQQLDAWCLASRELARNSGREEVCDVQIGEMLARSPQLDPDGSWPCRAIRNVIEKIATKSLCSGLSCGILNSRGATWRDEGGKQERDESKRYRDLAEKIRFDSPTTARVLDSIADSYDREASWWDEQQKWES
jgi:hypothetical protein